MFVRFAALLALTACAPGSFDVSAEDTDPEADAEEASRLAVGVDITKVALLQGIEVVLMRNGEAPKKARSPIVRGRDALLRIHVEPHSDWVERKIEAVVTVSNNKGTEVLRKVKNIKKASTQGALNSTINLEIPGDLLLKSTSFEVELQELEEPRPSGAVGRVTWHSDDTGGLDVQRSDHLDLVIVPIRYDYDGSGRLPDTSPRQIQAIEDLMYGMFPATDVKVTVSAPLPWNRRIDAFNGWEDLLIHLNNQRALAEVRPNTYFYGMFRPTDSINHFCSSGCILGLSLLGGTSPFFRASIGVGFPGPISVETVPHEIGHAHGREHAPCGLYGQPSDRAFPNNNADIGVWGYDLVEGKLFEPSRTKDVMSYCSPIWVSDYTWVGLLDRIQAVASRDRSATTHWRAVQVRADGELVPMEHTVQASPFDGEPRQIELLDGGGRSLGVSTGYFVPFSHLEGGLLLVPDRPGLYTVDLL